MNTTFKITIFFITCISSYSTIAKYTYSGSISIFAKNDNQLVLHEHGASFNSQKGIKEAYSYLEILTFESKTQSSTKVENVPKLITLKWTPNNKYIVGITNIGLEKSPNFIVFKNTGLQIYQKVFDCTNYILGISGLFCNSESILDYEWVNTQLGNATVTMESPSVINVCISNYCEKLILPTV